MAVPEDETNPMFPLTLDLRRLPPRGEPRIETPELIP